MSPSACGEGGAARLAVQAYLDGERLCDEGRVKEGIKLLRRAIDTKPELDNDEWPTWAQRLRAGLEHAANNPPPDAEPDVDLCSASINSDQIARLAALYRERHWLVIDGLISPTTCARARDEMAAEDSVGGLELSTVYASPSPDAPSVAVPDRRSDRICYVDLAHDALQCEERRWETVESCVQRIDALVRALKVELPEELGDVRSRQQPMISAYGEGARFERHCDNHCGAPSSEDAEAPDDAHHLSTNASAEAGCANRRRLSTVLYCVPEDWSRAHGGALRLYKSTHQTGGWEGDDGLADVQPRPGRLVLFASDERVPHEVLPVAVGHGRVRYALALWFIASREARAPTLMGAAEAQQKEPTVQSADGALHTATRRLSLERESETSVMASLGEEVLQES